MPQESHALTDAQHKQFLKASQEYRAADAKLNSVWRQLKGKLSATEFAALLKDQRQWIGSRREEEAKGLIAQSIPEVDAYTAAILSRVNELTERLGAKPAAKQEVRPAAKAAPAAPENKPEAAKPAPEKPAAAPAAPASQSEPVLTISKSAPAEPVAPAAKVEEPAAKSDKANKPTEAVKPAADDKPARIEIGLPYLEEEKAAAPEGKSPAAQKPSKPAEKPAVKPTPKPETRQPAKAPQQQGNAAPNYKRATGTPEHPLAKGDNPACSGLQIVSSRHYGTNVAAPFVEMILRNDRIGNAKTVRVNGYEIKKIQKPHQEMPKWRPNNGNSVVLDVFAHTVLNEIGVEYADGSVCTIDKRSGEKDFTNPYIF